MKRLLVLVAVLFPLSLFIAGCGGTGGSAAKTQLKPQEKEEMKAKVKAQIEQSMTKKASEKK